MTEHEQTLAERIEAALNAKPQRKGPSPWSSRKLVASIIGLLVAATGAIGGIQFFSSQKSTAESNQASITADAMRNYVSLESFAAGQESQDALVVLRLLNIDQKVNRIDVMVEGIAKSVYRMEGQVDAKQDAP